MKFQCFSKHSALSSNFLSDSDNENDVQGCLPSFEGGGELSGN